MQQALMAQNTMMAMLQQQMAQAQAQAQPIQQEYHQQEGAPLAPPVPPQERLERLPEPPSLGCDDEEDGQQEGDGEDVVDLLVEGEDVDSTG